MGEKMKYRKKPLVIEAFRYGTDEIPDWFINYNVQIQNNIDFMGMCESIRKYGYIPTLEGNMYVSEGDYIVKGVNGEIYPVKEDIFNKTYELVNEGALNVKYK